RALVARLAFPDDERGPAGALQRAQRFGVAGAVAGDLGPPVGGVVLGLARAALAIVPVPEAAVHEHGLAHGGEHKVGLARELAAVEPIAPRVADRARGRTHGALGAGVARLHRAHHGGALVGVEDVRAHGPQAVLRAASAAPASGARRCWESQRTTGTH